ncbi:MAG: ADP-ribosylglycohydrolase family protein [Candidatus Krumholzibacteriia bacterium]
MTHRDLPAGPPPRDRCRGALLGLACGDAVGTAVEFGSPGSFPPVTDLVGGGPFGLAPGQWTDDTAMALCLATSLVETGGSDPVDQLRRYLRWYRHGEMSCTGTCFDCGGTVREALERFERTGEPFCGSPDPRKAGNGSLMRLAPVPLFFARAPRRALAAAADSSRTTHAAATAVDACRLHAALILGALGGVAREELLAPGFAPYPGCWDEAPLHPEIAAIAAGSYRRHEPPEICGSGYVVRSLEAALWAFARAGSFREGCLLAVNLGDDADTTAAVYGQLAGAYFGEGGLPPEWLARLAWRERIAELADRLCAGSVAGQGGSR